MVEEQLGLNPGWLLNIPCKVLFSLLQLTLTCLQNIAEGSSKGQGCQGGAPITVLWCAGVFVYQCREASAGLCRDAGYPDSLSLRAGTELAIRNT